MTYEIDLATKVALVTGAGGGNGSAICRLLKLAGAKVIGIDLSFENCDISEDECRDYMDHKYNLDMLSNDFFEALDKKLKGDKVAQIDMLINNAGITLGNSFKDYSELDWQRTISVNMTLPFMLTQFLLDRYLKANCRIVNITSLASSLGFPDNPAYISSKGGLEALTRSMAFDLSDRGFCVNAVAPGYIKTRMTKTSWEDESLRAERDRRIMLGRWGEPEDVGKAVLFLCSPLASYITGQNIYVDGGWTAKGL